MKLTKKMLGLLLVAVMTVGLVSGLGYKEASAATKPGKPVIKLSETDEYGEVKITIEKTSNADGYRIFYKGQNDKSYTKLVELSKDGTKKRTFTAKNLESGVYSFRVRAYSKKSGKKVWGSFSKVVKIEVVDAASRAHDDRMHELAAELYPDLYTLVEDGKMGLTMTDDSFIYFTFGAYDMVDKNGNYDDKKETIEWIVVDYDEDEGKALLLSRYVVDTKPYNEINKGITWEECTLRSWLNESFLYNAFNKEEQKLIIKSDIKNNQNNEKGINGGNDTKDRVFLLSKSEAEKIPTSQIKGRLYNADSSYCWWLRTPGEQRNTASYVSSAGTLCYGQDTHVGEKKWATYGSCYSKYITRGRVDSGVTYTSNSSQRSDYVDYLGDKVYFKTVSYTLVDGIRPAIWVDLTQR